MSLRTSPSGMVRCVRVREPSFKSDRFCQFGRDQYAQNRGGAAHTSRDGQEGLRHRRMLVRQNRKTLADVMELLNFVQDGFKGHA